MGMRCIESLCNQADSLTGLTPIGVPPHCTSSCAICIIVTFTSWTNGRCCGTLAEHSEL